MFQDTLTDFSKGIQNRNLIINGLEAGGLYDVWILAYRNGGSAAERLSATWSTTNATTSASSQLLDHTAVSTGNTFVAGENFVLFANVQADVTGTITFDADATDARRSGLSGFQIQAVPEPGSLALLGVGGALIAARRRRS